MTDEEPGPADDVGVDRRDLLRASAGGLAAFALAGVTPQEALADSPRAEGDLADLLEGLPKNWGRWGEDDELGAFNFLGSEEAFAGLRAAIRGGRGGVETFTLQTPMTGEPSKDPIFPTRTVARRENTRDARDYQEGNVSPSPGGIKFTDDWFLNNLYPQGSTHLDAPGHAWYGDQIYNGFSEDTTAAVKQFDVPLEDCTGEAVDETRGLAKADIGPVADAGVVGRGVLLDVGREKGEDNDRLPPNACVTLSDLRDTADAQGTDIRERDVLVVRTGSVARARDPDPRYEYDPLAEPGICFSRELVEWVYEMEFPTIGADNLSAEKSIQTIDGDTYVVPLHGAFHRNLGMPVMEVLSLEDLAASAAADGVYEFLFAGAPLNIERATGAIINPVVVKATGGGDGDDGDDRDRDRDDDEDRGDGRGG